MLKAATFAPRTVEYHAVVGRGPLSGTYVSLPLGGVPPAAVRSEGSALRAGGHRVLELGDAIATCVARRRALAARPAAHLRVVN
jgi:hypothetical protein